MRIKIAMVLVLVAFCLWNIHLVYSVNSTLQKGLIPFRPKIEISKDGHMTYAGERAAMTVLIFAIFVATARKEFLLFSLLALGYLIDYILYYNGTLFYMWNWLPMSYTLVMAVVIFFTIIKTIIYD